MVGVGEMPKVAKAYLEEEVNVGIENPIILAGPAIMLVDKEGIPTPEFI